MMADIDIGVLDSAIRTRCTRINILRAWMTNDKQLKTDLIDNEDCFFDKDVLFMMSIDELEDYIRVRGWYDNPPEDDNDEEHIESVSWLVEGSNLSDGNLRLARALIAIRRLRSASAAVDIAADRYDLLVHFRDILNDAARDGTLDEVYLINVLKVINPQYYPTLPVNMSILINNVENDDDLDFIHENFSLQLDQQKPYVLNRMDVVSWFKYYGYDVREYVLEVSDPITSTPEEMNGLIFDTDVLYGLYEDNLSTKFFDKIVDHLRGSTPTLTSEGPSKMIGQCKSKKFLNTALNWNINYGEVRMFAEELGDEEWTSYVKSVVPNMLFVDDQIEKMKKRGIKLQDLPLTSMHVVSPVLLNELSDDEFLYVASKVNYMHDIMYVVAYSPRRYKLLLDYYVSVDRHVIMGVSSYVIKPEIVDVIRYYRALLGVQEDTLRMMRATMTEEQLANVVSMLIDVGMLTEARIMLNKTIPLHNIPMSTKNVTQTLSVFRTNFVLREEFYTPYFADLAINELRLTGMTDVHYIKKNYGDEVAIQYILDYARRPADVIHMIKKRNIRVNPSFLDDPRYGRYLTQFV